MPVLGQWIAESSSESDCSSASQGHDLPAVRELPKRGAPLPAWRDDNEEDAEPSARRQRLAAWHDPSASASDPGASEASEASATSSLDDTESENDSTSEARSVDAPAMDAALTPEKLTLLLGEGAVHGELAKPDVKSIKRALRSGANCRCSRGCGSKFMPSTPLRQLLSCLSLFLTLTKAGQDALLWSLASTPQLDQPGVCDIDSGDLPSTSRKRNHRRMYSIGGAVFPHKPLMCGVAHCLRGLRTLPEPLCVSLRTLPGNSVCRSSFCKLLGISQQRLTRCARSFRGVDMRFGNKGGTHPAKCLHETKVCECQHVRVVK